MRSRNIQADILALISNGEIWTIKKIAEEIEVHYNTVYRHVHDLSYRFNIQFYSGRINGGIQLILERKISVEVLTNEDIELIIITLSLMDEKSEGITQFIYELSKLKKENCVSLSN